MNTAAQSGVRGKTLRFTWHDGPTRGVTHEHAFHEDGTVEWYAAEATGARSAGPTGAKERVPFADESVTDAVRMVSYLSKSGYTLTVVLDFTSRRIVAVASNDKTWMPLHGSFEVL